MKTSEFKKKIEELGLKAYFASTMCVSVRANLGGALCVLIGSNDDYISFGEHLGCLDKKLRDELVITCVDYAYTPIKEREDNKKYYWKTSEYELPETAYLNIHKPSKILYIGSRVASINFNACFTEKEYEKMVEDGVVPDIFRKEEYNENV